MPCHLSQILRLRWQGGSFLLHRGHPLIAIFTHPLNVSITSMLKTMNTRRNAFSTPSQPPTWRFRKKRYSLELGVYGQKDYFIHNIQQLVICSAGGLRGFSLNFLALKHLLLLLGITQQSTSRWIWWCQKDRIVTIQLLTLILGRRARKGGGPSLTHRPDPTANFIRLRASAAVGPESREADGCPSFLKKRDRRERSFFS